MRLPYSISLSMLCLIINGCAVGPDYIKPKVIIPPAFKEARGKNIITSSNWKIAHPRDDANRGEWWKVFNDPYLDKLEYQLACYNQTIKNADANYRQARALVDEARSGFFPTLVGSFNLQRQKQGSGSTSFITTTGGTIDSGTATTTNVSTGNAINTTHSWLLNASWEPDIWGAVRRTVESDAAAAQASAALVAVTRLSAQASLAQYYYELRTLDTDQVLLNDTVRDYQKALQFTRNQYQAGIVSRADIVQAQAQLENTQALALNNGIARAQYEHAIAILIGRPPADFNMPVMPLYRKPPPIPVSIPSAWLERRPDIAQAERTLQQMNAQIGVAVAAYYPTLNLTASANAAGKKIFAVPALGWAYGPQLTDAILDGGLRSATVRAAEAGYSASISAYRQTVLTAFQDVEDNLAALRILKQQETAQRAAANSAKYALALVMNQYKAGTVPYSSVITAQITAYNSQKSAYDVVGLQMTAAVGLIKALGGGWNVHDIDRAG